MARYSKYTIVQGDTPQSVAHKATGTIHNWFKIVSYNGLAYPYIVQSVEEKMKNPDKLATIGDILVVPLESTLDSIDPNTLSNQEKMRIQELALGTDLSMVSDSRDWENSGGSDNVMALAHNSRGDLRLEVGVDNLRQATIARLMTEKGSLLMHPTYGSELYSLFDKATVEQAKLIEIEVHRTMLSDSRVSSVETVLSEIEGSTYRGQFTAEVQSLEASFEIVVQGDATGFIVLE